MNERYTEWVCNTQQTIQLLTLVSLLACILYKRQLVRFWKKILSLPHTFNGALATTIPSSDVYTEYQYKSIMKGLIEFSRTSVVGIWSYRVLNSALDQQGSTWVERNDWRTIENSQKTILEKRLPIININWFRIPSHALWVIVFQTAHWINMGGKKWVKNDWKFSKSTLETINLQIVPS